MQAPSVDVTKIKLDAKSIVYLFLALVVLILLYLAAQKAVGYIQAKSSHVAKMTSGSAGEDVPPALQGA